MYILSLSECKLPNSEFLSLMFTTASILNVQNLTQSKFPINLSQMNLMTKGIPLKQNLAFWTVPSLLKLAPPSVDKSFWCQ